MDAPNSIVYVKCKIKKKIVFMTVKTNKDIIKALIISKTDKL